MSKNEVPQIQAEILQSWPLEAQEYIAALQTYLQTLQTQIAELKNQLNQNSQNSSQPPSADSPFKRPLKKSRENSAKPRGGQVGHTRHLRELVPLEQVDEVIELYPQDCGHCQGPLCPSDQVGEPLRHQVWELPVVKAAVMEYQFYTSQCKHCLQLTQSQKNWPQTVPTGQFGPKLVATLGVLHGQYQLSLRQSQELANDLWQLPLSLGAVADSCHKVSVALEPSYQDIEHKVQKHPTNHVDETGWKREGKLRWLWVATNPAASLFKVTNSRCGKSLQSLIGEDYMGIVHSDRHKPYLKLEENRHQLCWAHLIRNLRGLAQRAGPAKEWAERCLLESEKLFKVWHRFKGEEVSRAELIELVEPIRAKFKSQLQAGTTLSDGKVKAFSREVLKLEERLYLFVKEPGVEPTNNAAEQALRCGVIWRKKCFGNQRDWGEGFVARVLSVRATSQKQGLNFLNYLSECLEAHWFKTPAPSLFATP
jgi:transposase